MSNETTPETSIRALFDKAESLKIALESQPNPNSPAYQQTLLFALSKYEECKKLINQASLFSTNESLEDLATSDMRCAPLRSSQARHRALTALGTS